MRREEECEFRLCPPKQRVYYIRRRSYGYPKYGHREDENSRYRNPKYITEFYLMPTLDYTYSEELVRDIIDMMRDYM